MPTAQKATHPAEVGSVTQKLSREKMPDSRSMRDLLRTGDGLCT